jgi:ElaB/YqjD/DUF883 family membrane-anchored ribosome-binding protein
MRTQTFLQRISNVFKPQVFDTTPTDMNNKPQIQPALPDNITPGTNLPANIPHVPNIPVSPATGPVSMAASEFKRTQVTDLKSWGMDQCINMNGNLQGLLSSLEIIIMNYKLEATAKEEELKGELTHSINIINDEIIRLNNEIAVIRDFNIPEKEREIDQFDTDMQALKSNTQYDLQSDYGSELFTILATSKARAKEIIRKFQTRIIELKTDIEKRENRIKTMRQQMENIKLFDHDILSRRMHIFFNGWLGGLEGMGTEQVYVEDTIKTFNDYNDNYIKYLTKNN